MNAELIDELVYKSGCFRTSYNDGKPELSGFVVSRETLDKFAETIVTHCINLIENEFWSDPDEVYQALDSVRNKFGLTDDAPGNI